MNIKNILVATDFSAIAKKAVEQALILTARYDAQLTVLHDRKLFEDGSNRLNDQIKELKKEEDEAEHKLLQCARETTQKHEHLNIRHEIIRGYSAPSAVLRYLNENEFDLVLIGTHGKSGLENLLLGSVAEKVTRYAPCPVLTISAEATVQEKFNHLLVPFDFSDHARTALKNALEICEPGGVVELVYVIDKDVRPVFSAWGMKSVMEMVPDIINKAQQEMNKIISGQHNPKEIKISAKVLEGQPHKELAAYINDCDCQLVVASTHGLVGLDRFLLGSTTERLIRAVHKPILTIKGKNLI